ncbi:sugar ABC transporter ATP-binding protein [Crateriforma conspicua]|uniref:Arabinose import ATP-binding protein AraG n=1 Tax=Crateriforma conspicua TaxID=2527996 RepID=A0A5C5Y3R4_9PLAN|nr:sugar ABC transporter ATP-binding protein [Crateriforma conspicua]QDV64890.1 Arabinose import ATP-binding protein AraG [Crateriforma conspicua]TWT70287.1 Arabinose import ATP-binding protein AraG [Crateriforma conspicua]
MPHSSSDQHRLAVKGISKKYPGVLALDNVDMDVAGGEVLAVVGENGAGKSTLMKILAGIQSPDQGHIRLNDAAVRFHHPGEAIASGIALIHQELNLHGNLSVAENIYLGREPQRLGWLNRRELNRMAESVLGQVGLDVAPTQPLWTLSTASRQLVEIAKAISINASFVIMDEPTSSLSHRETERLFGVVQSLKAAGVGIVYISHRLVEVDRLADRVEVLRDGKNSGNFARGHYSHADLINAMVGRPLELKRRREPSTDAAVTKASATEPPQPRLRCEGVQTAPDTRPIDLSVWPGEIVGIAGLVGSGRTELLQTIFGIRANQNTNVADAVWVDGQPVPPGSVRDAMRAGLALVPEDRKDEGLLIASDVRTNTTIAALSDSPTAPRIDRSWESICTQQMIQDLGIKTSGQTVDVSTLSGGNQQKVALGKWLLRAPKVLLLDEPTRGVDVGAKQEIYQLLQRLADQGMAILFVSSELEEVLTLADRVAVMCDGNIAGELTGDEISENAIVQLAIGTPDSTAIPAS